MDRLLTNGSEGPDVGELQRLLNARPPTQLSPLSIDNKFGPKTLARVKEFQRNSGLPVDGIVGPITMARLRLTQHPISARTGVLCANSDSAAIGRTASVTSSVASRPSRVTGSPQLASINLDSIVDSLMEKIGLQIRRLTPPQIGSVQDVYGSSLDFDRIFISTQTGLGGLPFTIAVQNPVNGTIQIMNCGTFTPDRNLLIHELAHVWQSQHHSNPTEFMINSVKGQAAATAANTAESRLDFRIIKNAEFPFHFPFSTYAFIPGRPFREYAAEQIANAVEHGDSSIISHIKSIPLRAVDGDNIASLSVTRLGDRRTPGIVF